MFFIFQLKFYCFLKSWSICFCNPFLIFDKLICTHFQVRSYNPLQVIPETIFLSGLRESHIRQGVQLKVFSFLSGPVSIQDNYVRKLNQAKKINFTYFWRTAPRKTGQNGQKWPKTANLGQSGTISLHRPSTYVENCWPEQYL